MRVPHHVQKPSQVSVRECTELLSTDPHLGVAFYAIFEILLVYDITCLFPDGQSPIKAHIGINCLGQLLGQYSSSLHVCLDGAFVMLNLILP